MIRYARRGVNHAVLLLRLTSAALLSSCVSSRAPCDPYQARDAESGACVPMDSQCKAGTAWDGAACLPGPMSCRPEQRWDGRDCVSPDPLPCPAGKTHDGFACVMSLLTEGGCPPAAVVEASSAPETVRALDALVAAQDDDGARPLGAPLVARFDAGQCQSRTVTMTPGKCYRVIATGAGVSGLDVQLVSAGPRPLAFALARTAGPTTILGAAPECMRWPLPIVGDVDVVLRASGTSTPVALQILEK